MSTASAASEEAVEPRAPIDSDIGQGESGSVVDPVAGHDDRSMALFAADQIEFACRGESGNHFINPGNRTDGVRDLSPAITGRSGQAAPHRRVVRRRR